MFKLLRAVVDKWFFLLVKISFNLIYNYIGSCIGRLQLYSLICKDCC